MKIHTEILPIKAQNTVTLPGASKQLLHAEYRPAAFKRPAAVVVDLLIDEAAPAKPCNWRIVSTASVPFSGASNGVAKLSIGGVRHYLLTDCIGEVNLTDPLA